MTVGENIRRIRKEKKLTQKQLGELCQINEVQIRQYEIGKANPKIETIEKIAHALQCPVYELREISEPQTTTESIINLFQPSAYELEKILPNPTTNPDEYNNAIKKIEKAIHKEISNSYADKKSTGNETTKSEISLTDIKPLFEKLNAYGKKEAVKRVEELTHLKQYTDK